MEAYERPKFLLNREWFVAKVDQRYASLTKLRDEVVPSEKMRLAREHVYSRENLRENLECRALFKIAEGPNSIFHFPHIANAIAKCKHLPATALTSRPWIVDVLEEMSPGEVEVLEKMFLKDIDKALMMLDAAHKRK